MPSKIDLAKAARTAIDMEDEGYAAYTSAAKKCANTLGRSTLQAIADKELFHKAEIEKFLLKITGKSATGSAVKPDTKLSEMLKSEILNMIKDDLKNIATLENDLTKTYEIAMGMETKGYDFYKKICEKTDDPEARDLFTFLMKEENMHYELLQDTYLYLTAPAQWFEKEEKWLVEG